MKIIVSICGETAQTKTTTEHGRTSSKTSGASENARRNEPTIPTGAEQATQPSTYKINSKPSQTQQHRQQPEES
jgi:hypothetical protein